ncbi:MAG: malonyl-ACP O-methyltransferase BioC [Lysobacterales bacterium]
MSLTPLDKDAIRSSFDRAASSYDQHAVLQREIESRLLERIEFQRREPAMILDLGCGTGSASRTLAGQFPQASVIALDWAPAMLAKAGEAYGAEHGSTFGFSRLCADMHALPLAARSADLVFSSLALQWSYDLAAIFREFRRIMKADAMLVFTCFGPDTLHELKQAWRAVDNLPHVNDYPDMHDIGDELQAAGFRDPVMDTERLTLEYPDVLSLMHELKGIGAHNVASKRLHGLTGKNRLQGMLQAYEAFRRGNRYPASYEIIYGTAFSPRDGQPVKTPGGDVATFSVDALRKRTRKGKPA